MKEAAEEFLRQWEQAYVVADKTRLASLYEDEAVMASHSAGLLRGKEKVLKFLGTLTQHFEIEIHDLIDDVRLEGNLVVLTCRSYAAAKPKAGGATIREAVRTILILKRSEEGGLRILYDISQPAPDVTTASWPSSR